MNIYIIMDNFFNNMFGDPPAAVAAAAVNPVTSPADDTKKEQEYKLKKEKEEKEKEEKEKQEKEKQEKEEKEKEKPEPTKEIVLLITNDENV